MARPLASACVVTCMAPSVSGLLAGRQAADVVDTFDEGNATSPVHKVQADHYAAGLKLLALHANGSMLVDDNAAVLAGICQSLADMKDVRPRWQTLIMIHIAHGHAAVRTRSCVK